MKGFLQSKIVFSLITVVMLVVAIAIPLFGRIVPSHAATTRAYAPWTQSDYDATNNRFNTQETTIGANNLNSLAPQWVLNDSTIQQIGQMGIAGNPVVNYDRVYIAAINDNLYGFDEQTGTLNWHIDLTQYQQGGFPDTLQVANGLVYVSVAGGENVGIGAFDANNDSKGLLWKTSHFTSSFAINNGVLYTSDGYAYNATSGKQLWYQQPPCGGSPMSYLSSMAVDSSQGLGYVDCYDVATLYAFHLSNGSIAWTAPLENQGHNTSIVAADGMVFVEGTYFSKLYAFDAQTGNSIWAATPAPSREPVIANGILYMSYWDNVVKASYVAAINAKKGPNPDGSFMWKVPTGFAYDTTVANGVLYQTGAFGGPIRAFDPTTGNSLGNLFYSNIGQIITPITIGDGMIVGEARDPSGTQYILYAITLPGTLPPPTQRTKLFLFMPGFTSQLSAADAASGNIPADTFGQSNGIESSLKKKFPGSLFIMYSYNGDDGTGKPTAYSCQDTLTHFMSINVDRLKLQIIDLMENYQNIDVYLVGHSYGGAVALALEADMKINGQISTNGGIIKGIITLDSPLGGVSGGPLGAYYLAASKYYKKHCQAATGTLYSLNELTQIFLGGPLYGSNNSLMQIENGGDFTNQEVADAEVSTTSVLAVGNIEDYLYAPRMCPHSSLLPKGKFLSTQVVADQSSQMQVFGRIFVGGQSTCPSLTNLAVNHMVVLTNYYVKQGINQFVGNKPITSLAVPAAGFQ